jgi:hypothetical protein
MKSRLKAKKTFKSASVVFSIICALIMHTAIAKAEGTVSQIIPSQQGLVILREGQTSSLSITQSAPGLKLTGVLSIGNSVISAAIGITNTVGDVIGVYVIGSTRHADLDIGITPVSSVKASVEVPKGISYALILSGVLVSNFDEPRTYTLNIGH